jgi:hypothetical protein
MATQFLSNTKRIHSEEPSSPIGPGLTFTLFII